MRPLLAGRDLASPLAWIDGAPISGAQFVAEAQALAERLPADGSPVNLCQDRYAFALGLAAALLRGQTSLMPPNALPDTLRQIGDGARQPYALVDQAGADCAGLPAVLAARTPGLAAVQTVQTVPTIAAGLEAVRLLTSGSTGQPQPHGKRWGSLVINIAGEAERLSALLDRPSLAGLNLVATVPPQHSYGLESSVLLALLGGACFDAARPFYPADIAAALARLPAPRGLVTTPFHLKALLQAGVELPPLALVLSATAPLSPQLAALAEQRSGGRTLEIYGCTEAGQVAARRTSDGEVWTTLGALQLKPAADAAAAGDDGAGLCVVCGGHVEQPTLLGDRLELLDSRHFRLLGRANDLIHVAGKRNSLAHLNFHLNRIEGVDDGAFWMPDDVVDGVARPLAFVVAPRLAAAQVVQALRQVLDAAFVPRRVVHVDALPREATGKLTSEALGRFARQHLAGAAGVDELTIAADHPAFDGHFPGHPVLPGVVLLSLLMEAVARRPALQARLGATPQIEQVKFLAPVGPGTTLQLTLRQTAGGVAFQLHQGAQAVARGELAAGHAG